MLNRGWESKDFQVVPQLEPEGTPSQKGPPLLAGVTGKGNLEVERRSLMCNASELNDGAAAGLTEPFLEKPLTVIPVTDRLSADP